MLDEQICFGVEKYTQPFCSELDFNMTDPLLNLSLFFFSLSRKCVVVCAFMCLYPLSFTLICLLPTGNINKGKPSQGSLMICFLTCKIHQLRSTFCLVYFIKKQEYHQIIKVS